MELNYKYWSCKTEIISAHGNHIYVPKLAMSKLRTPGRLDILRAWAAALLLTFSSVWYPRKVARASSVSSKIVCGVENLLVTLSAHVCKESCGLSKMSRFGTRK